MHPHLPHPIRPLSGPMHVLSRPGSNHHLPLPGLQTSGPAGRSSPTRPGGPQAGFGEGLLYQPEARRCVCKFQVPPALMLVHNGIGVDATLPEACLASLTMPRLNNKGLCVGHLCPKSIPLPWEDENQWYESASRTWRNSWLLTVNRCVHPFRFIDSHVLQMITRVHVLRLISDCFSRLAITTTSIAPIGWPISPTTGSHNIRCWRGPSRAKDTCSTYLVMTMQMLAQC
ncbi:hypothetical protein B0T10DRAFT_21594 [Thelonectria olida]|uniref:Uncharacterized protein n=1 Tax=Thelonectria olida TaxID=1576542 RepID=A0A9P8WGG6_9HYPO|nr:hypothetical protein B0T10DRAFT_21594 [Thelonectria olida]